MSRARKIRITGAPFDYRWPSGAISAFSAEANETEPMLKAEVADFIVEKGHGKELRKPRSKTANKRKTAVAKSPAAVEAPATDASAANIREDTAVDAARDAANGAVENGRAVDSGAS